MTIIAGMYIHFPIKFRNLNSRSLAAENRSEWTNKTLFERISFIMQSI
jgi:hypothetical protein